MSTHVLTPVFSKFALTAGPAVELYHCPNTRSHAYVDLGFFKEANPGSSLVSIALSTSANPATLTSTDFFLDDIELINEANTASLEKVIVGPNERLYGRVLSGSPVNIRLAGMEETNTRVISAGRLAAVTVPTTAITEIFNNNFPNTAYSYMSLTVFNASTTLNADISIWVSSAVSPGAVDRVTRFTLTTQDTTIIQNLTLAPNDRVFVQSNQANTEYFLNGIAVRTTP